MKKQLSITARRCIIAILLFPLWGLGGLFAAVTVTPLSADYGTKTVTFRVAWSGSAANDRVWVWVDLCPVTGTSPGTFAKAVISSPTAITGSISTVAGNTRGFYVTTSPSTVTATLSNATGKFNWCAYGSDYPPNAKDNGSGGYDLKGSPPFIINGTVEVNTNTYSGGTITVLTDATGCPGALCGKNGQAPGLLNCCATGTTNCSGTCKTTGTYTSNDGACTGACKTAYVQQRTQCGAVLNAQFGTHSSSSCAKGCGANSTSSCAVPAKTPCAGTQRDATTWKACRDQCAAACAAYIYYAFTYQVTSGNRYTYRCDCCD
jgi:hypothetical protein